jgi:signal transduction histidine kinase
MIGDLLDLTRIEAGQLPLQIEAVALSPLAEECLSLLQAQAAGGSVELLNTVVNGERVHADRTRLKQVVLNLLSNAVKYNRAGGQVRLAAQADQGMTRLDVVDTGLGIEPQHLAKLFEPFQRGAHRAGPIEGTGIGLAVSKSLAELMGGRIAVRSRPGEGSVFSVFLPSA